MPQINHDFNFDSILLFFLTSFGFCISKQQWYFLCQIHNFVNKGAALVNEDLSKYTLQNCKENLQFQPL